MRADILQNLKQARDELAAQTGTRARLIGDPGDPASHADRANVLSQIARHDNLVWFRIARHPDAAAHLQSTTLHIERLTALVAKSLDGILTGGPRVQVRITFDGYERDKREVYDIEEVRTWMRKVLVETVPQAIALLDPVTFHVAQATCNPVVRSTRKVGPIIGSPGRVTCEISHEWQIACYLAGIDARAAATRI